jgi:ParB/RepB/Spo0J family partition protein
MGLIELPIVRETKNGLQIATGHRRVAACVRLGLKSIKCVLRRLTDEQMAEVNLDENLKRKTLNPIEEARGYANFRDRFHRSEQWIADRFAVTRDIVAQRLRLLTFPQPIQDLIAKGLLTPSHAEAIAMAPAHKQLQLAQIVVQKKLTVKRTTEMAKESVDLEKANHEALENIALRDKMVDARLNRHGQQDWAEYRSFESQTTDAGMLKLAAMFVLTANSTSLAPHPRPHLNPRRRGCSSFVSRDTVTHRNCDHRLRTSIKPHA